MAHARMLAKQGIISQADGEAITSGLAQIQEEIQSGKFEYSTALEDIHMNVESRLKALIGDTAGKLPTARSRNDQVGTDFKIWVREALDTTAALLVELNTRILKLAEANVDVAIPGFTHMQVGQPVTFGHHLLAYVEMFDRDLQTLKDAKGRMNLCPLGSAALAGTNFPIDREYTAKLLGFDGPSRNSIDSVSDRDFAIDYLSGISKVMLHLSRLAEEIVLWMSPGFKFVALSDAWTTGSSIMPQKRNPDAAEIIRGKVGRVLGSLTALFTIMKALPLTFSKDMQEDKENTFDAHDTVVLCLRAMMGMVADLRPNAERMRQMAGAGYSTATDLADWLVQRGGLPFRSAHEITGKLVALAESRSCELKDLPLAELVAIFPGFNADVYQFISVENSVASKTSFGGTSPSQVRVQLRRWQQHYEAQ
jgi:argininosuccinate lyase